MAGLAAREVNTPSPPNVVGYEHRAMGSPLRLTLVGLPRPQADAAWAAVSAEIEAVEQALSRFRPTSDLVSLNSSAGDPDGLVVDRRLVAALAAADRAHRVTEGVFEPRIVGDLERLGYPGAERPTAAAEWEPATAGRRPTFADQRWLHLDPRRCKAAAATPLDLGGIGKGLALRWAMAVLERFVPEVGGPHAGALLEAGGDISARGSAPQEGAWLISMEDPLGGEEPAIVGLRNASICTSSTAVHRWRAADGRVVHHLVDPRTGEPGGAGLLSVTVAGPDPAWAEIWSKTLFLAGASGIGHAARSRGLAAWWVADDGAVAMTPAARERTAWVRGES